MKTCRMGLIGQFMCLKCVKKIKMKRKKIMVGGGEVWGVGD